MVDKPEVNQESKKETTDAVQGQEGSQGQGPVASAGEPDSGSRVVTMNEARAAVCASVIRVVTECADEYASLIAAGEGVVSETQRENDRRTLTAFLELGEVLEVMRRKFRKADKPFIMQPPRGVKVVR